MLRDGQSVERLNVLAASLYRFEIVPFFVLERYLFGAWVVDHDRSQSKPEIEYSESTECNYFTSMRLRTSTHFRLRFSVACTRKKTPLLSNCLVRAEGTLVLFCFAVTSRNNAALNPLAL